MFSLCVLDLALLDNNLLYIHLALLCKNNSSFRKHNYFLYLMLYDFIIIQPGVDVYIQPV